MFMRADLKDQFHLWTDNNINCLSHDLIFSLFCCYKRYGLKSYVDKYTKSNIKQYVLLSKRLNKK